MEFIHEDYLGDGVYALFDGFAIWLRANDVNSPSDEICLEPSVIRSLYRFNEHCEELIRSVQQKMKAGSSGHSTLIQDGLLLVTAKEDKSC